MLLGLRCSLCDRLGSSPCHECAGRLHAPESLLVPAGCETLAALFAYDEQGSRLIASLKYENDRSSLSWAAKCLADLLGELPQEVLITWAPTTSARRRARGYDQAELLAKMLARYRGARCRACLLRSGTISQTGRSADLRVSEAPSFVASSRVKGRPVLLVDDVCTTGATLKGAATALRDAGATSVGAVVLAYTNKRVGTG